MLKRDEIEKLVAGIISNLKKRSSHCSVCGFDLINSQTACTEVIVYNESIELDEPICDDCCKTVVSLASDVVGSKATRTSLRTEIQV